MTPNEIIFLTACLAFFVGFMVCWVAYVHPHKNTIRVPRDQDGDIIWPSVDIAVDVRRALDSLQRINVTVSDLYRQGIPPMRNPPEPPLRRSDTAPPKPTIPSVSRPLPPPPPPGRIMKEGSFESPDAFQHRWQILIDDAKRQHLITLKRYYNTLPAVDRDGPEGKWVVKRIRELSTVLAGSVTQMRAQVSKLTEDFNRLWYDEQTQSITGKELLSRIQSVNNEIKQHEETMSARTTPGGDYSKHSDQGWTAKFLVAGALVLMLFGFGNRPTQKG